MLLSNIRPVALAAAAAAVLFAAPTLAQDKNNTDTSIPDYGQSTFVSPDEAVSFGLTVPLDAGEDILFTIRVPVGVSWGAIGLGQEHMAGSLILMIYMNAAGDNVTLSPRVARGNYEPVYYPELKYQYLPGTGIFNNTMIVSARCTSMCRHWPGGYIDVSDPNQKAIYAVGPSGGIFSDNPAAAVKYHEEFGTFRIDMKRTNGPADAPFLTEDSVSIGTVLGMSKDGKQDFKATFHAVLMIFSIVGLMPLGVIVLRLGEWVRWHALNQGLAMLFVIVGSILGILSSLLYTRSRAFKSPHQIIGLIVLAFVFIQFTLGFLHHRQHKKTQQPTKYAPIHVWLGRIIIFLGTFNAFLGFPFALNRQYNYILAGLIIAIFSVSFFVLFGKDWMRRRRLRNASGGAGLQGYQPEPWRQADTRGGYGAPGETDAPPQHIGLTNMVRNPGLNREKSPSGYRNNDIGAEQRPRELV